MLAMLKDQIGFPSVSHYPSYNTYLIGNDLYNQIKMSGIEYDIMFSLYYYKFTIQSLCNDRLILC